jgi:hypothetical protein
MQYGASRDKNPPHRSLRSRLRSSAERCINTTRHEGRTIGRRIAELMDDSSIALVRFADESNKRSRIASEKTIQDDSSSIPYSFPLSLTSLTRRLCALVAFHSHSSRPPRGLGERGAGEGEVKRGIRLGAERADAEECKTEVLESCADCPAITRRRAYVGITCILLPISLSSRRPFRFPCSGGQDRHRRRVRPRTGVIPGYVSFPAFPTYVMRLIRWQSSARVTRDSYGAFPRGRDVLYCEASTRWHPVSDSRRIARYETVVGPLSR